MSGVDDHVLRRIAEVAPTGLAEEVRSLLRRRDGAETSPPLPPDPGRWEQNGDDKWLLPAETDDFSGSLAPGIIPPEEPGSEFGPDDDCDRMRTSWRISGDGATAVTADDLEAAARIIRWHEEHEA